jgi:hypothetical protein
MKIELELDFLEMNQLEAALLTRLADAALADIRMTPGTPEAEMVAHEVRYTGSALTKLQLVLHGSDEPDEPNWLTGDCIPVAIHTVAGDLASYADWTEAERRWAAGDR